MNGTRELPTRLSRVLITGANGYIGRFMCETLRNNGYIVRAAVRSREKFVSSANENIAVGEINSQTNWKAALLDVDYVIHLAALAHVNDLDSDRMLSAFRETNVDGTRHLVDSSSQAQVKRFIFVSSIGVHGDLSIEGPIHEGTPIRPTRLYQIAKWEAEQVLRNKETALDYVIVRPPLVYGPNAPGNLSYLVKLMRKRIPLPLAGIRNYRSFIGIRNLSDFLTHCLHHPLASNEVFVISDGHDLSTPDFVRHLSKSLGIPVVLFPVPISATKVIKRILRNHRLVDQLWGSLQIDPSKASLLLGWRPPFTVDEEMIQLSQSKDNV